MKILDIYKNILLEDFKTQRKKFIEQGYSSDIVDTYLRDFDEIRKSKFKEAREAEIRGLNVPKGDARFNVDSYKTFRELEILVDFVAGQRKVGSANFEDIKVDGEPIFRNEDVEIYYADTPRACIQYKGNFPYSWCVARNDSGNMFYNYRLREHEPAFYFVKLIKRTKKEFEYWNNKKENFSGKFKDEYHFFVVQVTNNNEYIVTSAENDEDVPIPWDEILTFAPELTELKEIFQPKPLSKEEREKIEKYKNGLLDEQFAKLPYKEKEFYLAVYVKVGSPITFEQFRILPEDLKNKYVGFGVGLSDEQFELIKDNKNLIKRYSEITKRKIDNIAKDLNDDFIKTYSDELLFTKSEQLFIQDEIHDLLDDEFINQVYDVDYGYRLDTRKISFLLKYTIEKDKYIDKIKNKFNDKLNIDNMLNLLPFSSKKDELIGYYLSNSNSNTISFEISKLIPFSSKKDELIDYFINLGRDGLNNDEIKKLLPYSSKKDEHIDKIINVNGLNSIELLLQFSPQKDELIDKIINVKGDKLNWALIYVLLNDSSKKDEIIKKLIKIKVPKKEINFGITLYNFDNTQKIPLIPTDELNEQIKRIHTLLKII